MSFHVQRTRVRDTSADREMGHPDKTGQVSHSKTFPTAEAAQREADAWNGEGPFAKHGPTDWHAIVVPGRAPRAKKVAR